MSGVFIPLLLSHFFFKIPFIFEGCLTSMSRSIQRFTVFLQEAPAPLVFNVFIVFIQCKVPTLPIVREWSRFASCHPPFPVMHVQSVRPLVPLVPPVPGGGGTARSQASFPNSRHWRFVLFLSLFFLILKVVTVLTTHAFLTAENKGLSFTEMVLPSNLFHARSLVSFNVDLKYTN